MAAPVDLYPLSTPDGKSIPLDVVSPTAWMYIPFNSSTGTSAIALPANSDLIILRTTEDCLMNFTDAICAKPAASTLSTGKLFLPKDFVMTISPATKFISVLGDRYAGVLSLQFVDAWHGLALASDYSRV